MCVLLCMCVFVLLSLHSRSVKILCGRVWVWLAGKYSSLYFCHLSSCSLPYPNSFIVIMKSRWLSGYRNTAMITLCRLDRPDDMITDWFCLKLLKILKYFFITLNIRIHLHLFFLILLRVLEMWHLLLHRLEYFPSICVNFLPLG